MKVNAQRNGCQEELKLKRKWENCNVMMKGAPKSVITIINELVVFRTSVV